MPASIGERIWRVEDERLLRGEGAFVSDQFAPNVAHAAFLRSPAACADIIRIDITAALATDGVVAVLTGADVIQDGLGGIPWEVCPPGHEKEARFQGDPEIAESQPLLAHSRVRYVGEPIAMVIGNSQAAALNGVDAINVDFEYGEATVGIQNARISEPCAEALFTAEVGDRIDTDAVFKSAFGVVQIRTHIPRLAAAPMEPRGYLSDYSTDDQRWTIWATEGKPNPVRDTIAKHILHVDPERIRLVANDIGGGFGGKNVTHAEAALTLWAAKRIGRPVRWISTRLEAFQSDMQGRDHLIEARLAYSEDGFFTAVSYDSMVDVGAYLSPRGVMPALTSLKTITGPYRIGAAHGRVRGILTNTVPTGPYRGAGAPECAYAVERLVDMAAAKLAMDPVALRRRNLIRPESLPWTAPTGVTFHSVDFPAVLEAAVGGRKPLSPRRKSDRFCYGVGVAFTIECYAASLGESAEVLVREDGSIEIRIGTKSSGQSHETTYAQIAADAFGLPCERFKIIQGDTRLVRQGNGTGASRSLTVGGSAIIRAIDRLLDEARVIAAQAMQCSPETLDYAGGTFTQRGVLASSVSIFALCEAQPNGCLRGVGDFKPSQFTIPGGCHVASVEVDKETGRVRVLDYRLVHDAGVAVNPTIVEGQLHGGIVQGIGAALSEMVHFDAESGQLVTASFQDYAMPRAASACGLSVSLLGVRCASNLIGAKPVGEAGTVGAPPAIINAIINAIDCPSVSHIELPATSERVWQALQGRYPSSLAGSQIDWQC
ncbi:MAG: carbon monoxide dehydrogenase [Rhizobium sp.]|nr:carbon monoxide dehydrogenase [Rhizobium sp.]